MNGERKWSCGPATSPDGWPKLPQSIGLAQAASVCWAGPGNLCGSNCFYLLVVALNASSVAAVPLLIALRLLQPFSSWQNNISRVHVYVVERDAFAAPCVSRHAYPGEGLLKRSTSSEMWSLGTLYRGRPLPHPVRYSLASPCPMLCYTLASPCLVCPGTRLPQMLCPERPCHTCMACHTLEGPATHPHCAPATHPRLPYVIP